jgi:hypothetical protein
MEVGPSTYVGTLTEAEPEVLRKERDYDDEDDEFMLPVDRKLSDDYPTSSRSGASTPRPISSSRKPAEAYSLPVAEETDKTVDSEPGNLSDFLEPVYIWGLSFILILLAGVYFYWLNFYECCAAENMETNMTIDYAIEQTLKFHREQEKRTETTLLQAQLTPLPAPSPEAKA